MNQVGLRYHIPAPRSTSVPSSHGPDDLRSSSPWKTSGLLGLDERYDARLRPRRRCVVACGPLAFLRGLGPCVTGLRQHERPRHDGLAHREPHKVSGAVMPPGRHPDAVAGIDEAIVVRVIPMIPAP
mgnify:CR=1 FL=1